MRVGAAIDAPRQHLRGDEIGRVLGAARHLLRPVHHGHVAADRMPRRVGLRAISFMALRNLARRQQAGGMLHRLDDLHVAGAAADVAAERRPDLVLARARIAAQEAGGRHDEARRAVAALGARASRGSRAARPRARRPAQRLDGVDALAGDCCRQRQARQRGLVVDQHRAGAALAAVAPGLGAGQADGLAQVVEQQPVVGDRVGAPAPVQRELENTCHGPFPLAACLGLWGARRRCSAAPFLPLLRTGL